MSLITRPRMSVSADRRLILQPAFRLYRDYSRAKLLLTDSGSVYVLLLGDPCSCVSRDSDRCTSHPWWVPGTSMLLPVIRASPLGIAPTTPGTTAAAAWDTFSCSGGLT